MTTEAQFAPPHIFKALNTVFDAAPSRLPGLPPSWVTARRLVGESEPWEGVVWCHPPKDQAASWLEKLEGAGDSLALVPCQMGEAWAQEFSGKANATCFLSSPVRLLNRQGEEIGGEGERLMILARGQESARALELADLGLVMKSHQPAPRTPKASKRRDYRSAEPGTFEYFILYEFPHGHNYSGIVGSNHWQLHDNRRDRLGNWQSLAGGKPDLSTRFVADLEAIPNLRFEQAINELEKMNNLRVPGYQMVNALRYVWFADELKRKGVTREMYCQSVGMSPSDLTRHLYAGIDWVAQLVFKGDRKAA